MRVHLGYMRPKPNQVQKIGNPIIKIRDAFAVVMRDGVLELLADTHDGVEGIH